MTEFDYLVVGGGTAGCIVAARLAGDPGVSVGLVEWGPSDEHEPRARSIRRWAEMLEGEYDLDYRSVPQERGNSRLRQAPVRILGGCSPANTMVSLRARAVRLVLDSANRAAGVAVRTDGGGAAELTARREVIVCAGSIDSPRLLQLSGIGPPDVLRAAGVDVRVDLPGVGANLMDHAEGIVVWEVAEPPSRVCATGWDAGALLRLTPEAARPDIAMHFPVEAWVDHVVAYGTEMPPHYMAIAPNVAKPRSRGRIWITSADPDDRPAIDYRYFTDPDG